MPTPDSYVVITYDDARFPSEVYGPLAENEAHLEADSMVKANPGLEVSVHRLIDPES